MFTETVQSRRIAMESKAMSIECKTEFHKNYANINAIHICFFHTNYRLQKHKQELVICPEAALKIQNEYNDISARLYSVRPQQF